MFDSDATLNSDSNANNTLDNMTNNTIDYSNESIMFCQVVHFWVSIFKYYTRELD